MKVNRSISIKLYKLFLKYTYPLIIMTSTNNRIFYNSSDSYWIDLFSMWVFYNAMSNMAIILPIFYAIARYHKPFINNEGLTILFSYALVWVPLVYLLHRRNRIKSLFNRMKVTPLEEVKALKKRYLLRFMLYYMIPTALGFIIIFSLP